MQKYLFLSPSQSSGGIICKRYLSSSSPSSSSSSDISNNSHSSSLVKYNNGNSFSAYKFYSTKNQKTSTTSDHSELDTIMFYDKEEFKRKPKFFKLIALLVAGGVIFNLYNEYLSFDSDEILSDIKTILSSDDPSIRNSSLKQIYKRSTLPFTIEKMYKLGVVEVLVKSLDDIDPTVQATAIKTLSSFINNGYETYGNEAIKKGAGSILSNLILSNGMNTEAASILWVELFLSKTNQMQLLTSKELLNCLKTFSSKDEPHLQEVCLTTIKILFANREVYPMMTKTKPILNQLKKSQNVLVSNVCEYYLSVLNGQFIPPVGTIQYNEGSSKFNLHTGFNLLMAPLAYVYCCYRWKSFTNDPIYWKAKGIYGAGSVLLAGILATITLYPEYSSNKIDARLKTEFSLNPSSISEFEQFKKGFESIKLKDDSNNNNNNSEQNTNESADSLLSKVTNVLVKEKTAEEKEKEKQKQLEKQKEKEEKEKKPSALFSPNSLFVLSQMFPILGNMVWINGWRHSRYIMLPTMVIVYPILFKNNNLFTFGNDSIVQ
ncbi:hypothetical protein CYY_004446 [Polysphondylium violaceum]|uniref:Armadillo repeat-containing domain-containing protein n=1 Tax=Polysphondylium violaceum TaxID=133409 RepID=A0A8J4UT04_9MYCE|nr:hypothetical protein CYY_004446 [Polysphondylium violaceum]